MTSDSSTVKKKRRKTKVLYVRGRRCLAFPPDTQTDPGIGCAFSLQNRALCHELDAERKASAVAANEAMAMIARLHEEKSLLDLASRQYKRLAEEREAHYRETISLLKELLLHRDRDSENHQHHHFHHFDHRQHHPCHHRHPHCHTKDWPDQTDDYTVPPPRFSSSSYSSSSSSSSSSSLDISDDDIMVRDLADSFASDKAPEGAEKASAESGSLLFLSEAGKVALINEEKTRAQDMKDSSVESSRTRMAPLQQQQSVLLRLFKDFISLMGHLCQKRVRRLCQKDREPPWSYKGNGGFPCMLEMQNLSRKK